MFKRLILVLLVLLVSLQIVLAQETLTPGQLVSVDINADQQAPSLVFTATAGQRLSIQVASTTGSLFPIFTIYTLDGEILQYTGNPARSPLLEGVAVIPLSADYRLEIWNLDSISGQVIVLVEDITGTEIPPANTTPASPLNTPMPTSVIVNTPAQAAGCTLTSNTSLPVNVREGPSTVFRAIAAMPPGGTYPVTARDNPSDWYQITINGAKGWVAASVTQLEGDCANLEVLAIRIPTLTPTPTPTPTATFTPTPTPTSTETPELGLVAGTPDS
jgi:hypothetical protein